MSRGGQRWGPAAEPAASATPPCTQAELRARATPLCRIDGTMSAEERADEVAHFQAPRATVPVFLLTSQVPARRCRLAALPAFLWPCS
jgi:hypothetical protein